MPSCSLDDFSGARGPLFGSNGGRIFFHGRHIFSSLLRDLVANYGIDSAENVVLVGSGNLKGDYLASDILGLFRHCVSVIVNAIVNGTFYLDIFNCEVR